MSRVLVTGAAGFIGRALTRALHKTGCDVTALSRSDGEITDPAMWARLPPFEHVFHLAGRSYVPDSWQDPAGFIHANVIGTTLALDYCRSSGAHLVFASTLVFGIPKRQPTREDDPGEPSNPYALSKFLAERACAFFASTSSTCVTIVRFANIFGPAACVSDPDHRAVRPSRKQIRVKRCRHDEIFCLSTTPWPR